MTDSEPTQAVRRAALAVVSRLLGVSQIHASDDDARESFMRAELATLAQRFPHWDAAMVRAVEAEALQLVREVRTAGWSARPLWRATRKLGAPS